MTTTTFTLTVSEAPTTYIGATVYPNTLPGEFSAGFGAVSGINAPCGYNGTLYGEAGFPGSSSTVAEAGAVQAFNAPTSAAINSCALDWCGAAHYDSQGKNWWYQAGTVGNTSGSSVAVRYSVTENKWRHWCGSAFDDVTTCLYGVNSVLEGSAHNFYSTGYDPLTRRLWRWLQGGGSYTGSSEYLGWFSADNAPGASASTGRIPTNYNPPGYYPLEIASLVGEAFAVFNSVAVRFSLSTGQRLSPDISLPTAVAGKRCCTRLGNHVYLTGDNGAFCRIDTSVSPLVVETLAPCVIGGQPIVMTSDGGNVLSFTILTPLLGSIYAFQLSPNAPYRGVYRYDPNADQWTDMSVSSFPTIMPISPPQSSKWTVGAIESEGCVLVVTKTANDRTADCYIWRPA